MQCIDIVKDRQQRIVWFKYENLINDLRNNKPTENKQGDDIEKQIEYLKKERAYILYKIRNE
jgi:hypothetical protein